MQWGGTHLVTVDSFSLYNISSIFIKLGIEVDPVKTEEVRSQITTRINLNKIK